MNVHSGATLIAPAEARRRIEADGAILIDIREPAEFAREHPRGARLVPLAAFDAHDFGPERDRAAIFTCRTGARTVTNAPRFAAKGFREVLILEGGLEGWKRAGLPVELDRRVPIDLMRQVQIAVGAIVLAGTVLAAFVSPWFAAIPAFAGGGLLVAGVTGFCGMARLLRRMPWNRGLAAPAG